MAAAAETADALDTLVLSGVVGGVLFDIDDTLVDLRHAAVDGFLAMVHDDFCVADHVLRFQVAADFADDGAHAYERYMAGELTFLEQRILRVQRAYDLASIPAPDALALTGWAQSYESYVRSAWKPSQTFKSTLRHLSALGIPFGAVSNNVEAYQREKLRLAGLDMFEVVIGSDTAGAPKPDAAPFLAGCEQLGSAPGRTLCLDDNLINNVVGARNAGLPAVLLIVGHVTRIPNRRGWKI